MKFFHQRRLQELRQSLIFYVEVSVHLSWSQLKFYCLSLPQLRYNGFTKAETQFCISFLIYQGQIKCSRESQASLTGCLAKMKEFSVPQVDFHLCFIWWIMILGFQVKDSMFDPNDNEWKWKWWGLIKRSIEPFYGNWHLISSKNKSTKIGKKKSRETGERDPTNERNMACTVICWNANLWKLSMAMIVE